MLFDIGFAFLLTVLIVGLLLDAIVIQFPWDDAPESLLRRRLREFGEWMRR